MFANKGKASYITCTCTKKAKIDSAKALVPTNVYIN